jgi:putative copper export protein
MKTILYTLLVASGVLMVIAMTKLLDGSKFSNVSECTKAWRSFRKSRSGNIWFVAYLVFLSVFLVLSLDKYGVISIGV